ncbi:hypothetical protein EYZ11_000179 [Aspergillus tanneri]|uniref:Uncharacterized protein n=1 Tax=Aspergillus tanneri TaxID=1220188 RepID=A0A4S3JXQ3_9EURO|nr:uncharacterized protein ATNIH1004_006436 [Aspergillus tanneri]KAA8647739.1 hypothetical protein ATNIH1004_006436 [Aspergillus tanneri]THD00286.1 hypothetical protein EYZ11_000179 [Aspergillus tanneri]
MSGVGISPSRSGSAKSRLRSRDQADPCIDTALPPMSSKQFTAVSSRRLLRGSESSVVLGSVRGNQQAAAALGGAPMPGMTRGPNVHRRTGSTLKTVMKKIFNRKRGSQLDDFDSDVRLNGSNTSRPDRGDGIPSYSLSSSLSSKRTYAVQKETEAPLTLNDALEKLEIQVPRQRRATLPSLIFSDDESRGALGEVVPSGRAAGGSRKSSLHLHPNSDQENRRRRRRSRSAGALRGMAKDHRMSPIQWRRRSIESYVGSTAYTVASDNELSLRPPTRATVTSLPEPSTEPSMYEVHQVEAEAEAEAEAESIAPNVGNLVNTMQHDENISLGQRLTTLEVKLIDLEFAIARIQGGRSDTSPVETPPSKKADSATSRRHNRGKSTARSSPDPYQSSERPASTGTIRPGTTGSTSGGMQRSTTLQQPSSTSLSDTTSISVEQYSALVTLLRREQTARRNLEAEVSGLREDIQQLQRMARNSVGIGTMYPIRSADSQEFLRVRQGRSTTSSSHTEDNPGSGSGSLSPSPYESDSECDRPALPAKDDFYKPRWQATRRMEVAGMI